MEILDLIDNQKVYKDCIVSLYIIIMEIGLVYAREIVCGLS